MSIPTSVTIERERSIPVRIAEIRNNKSPSLSTATLEFNFEGERLIGVIDIQTQLLAMSETEYILRPIIIEIETLGTGPLAVLNISHVFFFGTSYAVHRA